ncbi:hypothetical protein [Pseudomonas putida]|uniref:Uncharacterized protein n=1 Tax=Pseudomonas putida TaxID=303 RepID=A0A1B2F182_PSEPU|nr:hypothetical protein [Pseudomonas putida]ANY85942.1 hypothetical protein IEC33019_0338 [Pseudomonas putida]
MINYFWFFIAALFEIIGCYAFYLWLRVESAYAGRAYAAYGGIYIVSSLLWLALVERARPMASDWLGALLCVMGATLIVFGPRLQQG